MSSDLNLLVSPIETRSPFPVTSSPIAKILKQPDMLSLVLTCLEWNSMVSTMGTCRDFARTVEKIVSVEMTKTTDLEAVFHKYVCWFVKKKYEPLPPVAHAGLRNEHTVFDQLVSTELTKLNLLYQRSSHLQTGENRIILPIGALLMQVFKCCPNLTTFDLEFFNPYQEKGFRADFFSNGEVLLEVLDASLRSHPRITTLDLGSNVVVANAFFNRAHPYPQLSNLSLEIEELKDLEAASALLTKFPRLNHVHVSFTDNDEYLTKADLLRIDLPGLTSIYIQNNQIKLIEALGEKYPQLKELQMYVGATFKKEHFQAFGQYFHELTLLHINGPELYDMEALGLPAAGQSERGDEGLQIIGSRCKKLTEVAFNLGLGIRVETAINFCRNLPHLTTFTTLSDPFTPTEAKELILAAPLLTHFVFFLSESADLKHKARRVEWAQEKIEEVRESLKAEKKTQGQKRRVDNLVEEKTPSSELSSTQVLDDSMPTTQPIEETTPKAKKARKEE